jgi:hypothetical protein
MPKTATRPASPPSRFAIRVRYALIVWSWLFVAFAAAAVVGVVTAPLPTGPLRTLAGLLILVVLFGLMIGGPIWTLRKYRDRIRGISPVGPRVSDAG